MSLPTLRIRLGLWKWVQLYFWFKTNKQMAGSGVFISRGINWWKLPAVTVSAHGDASSHFELVSWSPNWSQSSKEHPTPIPVRLKTEMWSDQLHARQKTEPKSQSTVHKAPKESSPHTSQPCILQRSAQLLLHNHAILLCLETPFPSGNSAFVSFFLWKTHVLRPSLNATFSVKPF